MFTVNLGAEVGVEIQTAVKYLPFGPSNHIKKTEVCNSWHSAQGACIFER